MESAEISPPLPCDYFERTRPHHRAFGLPGRRRPHGAVRHRGHGAVQAVLPGPAHRRRIQRAADVQKCVRTLDIEDVGKTTRHATFFQMLGNLSFGDYFKDGAITYAWELLTSEADGGSASPRSCGPPSTRTTTRRRDLAERDRLPAERIQRRGMDDNYWHMGVPGPCGRARRSTTTAGPNTAARAARSPTRTATSRSGTSSSCRTS